MRHRAQAEQDGDDGGEHRAAGERHAQIQRRTRRQ